MTDALSVTEISMANDMLRMHSISHNLANATTPGFSRDVVSQTAFQDLVDLHRTDDGGNLEVVPVSVPRLETSVDYRPGSLHYTGNALDLAIENGGYLEITTDSGVAYTKRGSLRLDSDGRLVTAQGYPVNFSSGEGRLTTSNPVINENGEVTDGAHLIGRLAIVSFGKDTRFSNIGDGLIQPEEGGTIEKTANARVRQGFQETANVDMTMETVRMVETVRHFEASQKVIKAYDDLMDNSLRILGDF